MKTVYLNGKFTAQATTGVQRVSANLIQALDAELAAVKNPATRWVLLCPAQGVLPDLKQIQVRRVGLHLRSLNLWEQCVLPWAARGGLLLNLSGSAPAFKRLQVCTFHDAAVFDRPDAYTRVFATWYRFLFKRLGRMAALIITVSEFSKQRLMLHLQLPENRVQVVRNGAEHLQAALADHSLFERLKLANQPYFLAVGSNNPTKNHATLVQAFKALRPDMNAVLVIVGGNHQAVFASVNSAHHEHATPHAPRQVLPRVLHIDAAPDGQLKVLFQHARALVFPSTYEGYGLPPLEAMSLGCAVLASRMAAIPEVCADAALYFDPVRAADITASLERFLSDPGIGATLCARGAERIKALTWPNAARALLSHLHAAGLIDVSLMGTGLIQTTSP
jgi:glycosyltransferase involved in cell wall biosynthesis